MNKLFVILILLIFNSAVAQPIATCTDPDGYANYHYAGVVKKKDAGFQKDKITGGMTTIQKLDNGAYDILIVDARKRIISMVQDGGKVILLRKSSSDATFMHYYPNMAIELYTLWTDSEGKSRYDMLQSKGGDQMLVHKSAVMTGVCDVIRFDLIN